MDGRLACEGAYWADQRSAIRHNARQTPALLGWIRVEMGSLSLGLQISAAIIATATVILLVGIPARALRERR